MKLKWSLKNGQTTALSNRTVHLEHKSLISNPSGGTCKLKGKRFISLLERRFSDSKKEIKKIFANFQEIVWRA